MKNHYGLVFDPPKSPEKKEEDPEKNESGQQHLQEFCRPFINLAGTFPVPVRAGQAGVPAQPVLAERECPFAIPIHSFRRVSIGVQGEAFSLAIWRSTIAATTPKPPPPEVGTILLLKTK